MNKHIEYIHQGQKEGEMAEEDEYKHFTNDQLKLIRSATYEIGVIININTEEIIGFEFQNESINIDLIKVKI